MEASWSDQLEHWHEFFVLSGTAAATLMGALFVVISLGPSIIASENKTGVRAFISPNAVHFCAVLAVSHLLLGSGIPRELTGWTLCLGALLSIVYMWWTRAPRRWREKNLSAMDWIWYIALPYAAYVLTVAASIFMLRDAAFALPALGATMVFLLIVGARNAWDLAVWMPQQETQPAKRPPESGQPKTGGPVNEATSDSQDA